MQEINVLAPKKLFFQSKMVTKIRQQQMYYHLLRHRLQQKQMIVAL